MQSDMNSKLPLTAALATVLIASGTAFFASPAKAVVLTFDMGATNFDQINPTFAGYGDNVTSTTEGNFTYGAAGGFTPNIVADYSTGAAFWNSNYGNLSNVLYAEEFAGGIFGLTLTADPGFKVSLDSFDLAGWPNTDYTINSLEVLAGSTALFSASNVVVQGDSSGPRRTSFDFDDPFVAQSLTIRFDASNLAIIQSDNIGIDNVRFSQVPEPSSVLGVLGFGALGVGSMWKRKRRRSSVS